MRIASAGHAAFAAMMVALGIMGLITGAFAPIWQPAPQEFPAREALVYVCACISLACGIGVFWRRTAAAAARVLLVYFLLWWLLFRMSRVLVAPLSQESWSGAGETAVIVAAAWVCYAWFATDWDRQQRLGFAVGENGLRIARAFYGLSMIPFGIAHFVYAKETASLVPAWLPLHLAWAYITGSAFIAAGLAIIVGISARLAAVLSAWQIGLFTLLVWLPIMANGAKGIFEWSETIISLTLTVSAWVVADSYRSTPAIV
jgi:uncharacterized membrane protein